MQLFPLQQAYPAETPSETFSPLSVRLEAIEGRFRQMSAHELSLAWWLHSAGHLTRRQLRVWFAAHEMHERRRYTLDKRGAKRRGERRQPSFPLAELKALVGGRGSTSADAKLRADVRHLARIGLVRIEEHEITFAKSADQITVSDLSGFWTMFAQVPNQRRTVPVPRRTLRALAGGFSRAVTGVMIALMIRSLFWHRESEDYRIDGRTKGSWISDVFDLSRRAVTDARAHLIELGWLTVLQAPQWQLNRWGTHDSINVEWTPRVAIAVPEAVGEGSGGGEFASPSTDYRTEIASPDLNSSPLPEREDLKTRRLGRAPDPAGVCAEDFSRKGKEETTTKTEPPRLHDVRPGNLRDTKQLLELYAQAVKRELVKGCEADRLNFVALAERASARGRNPGAMFSWLLHNRRFDFITQADEDAACWRLREWRNGPAERTTVADPLTVKPKRKAKTFSEDDKFVRACLQVAERRRLPDAYWVARQVKPNWTRERWDAAVEALETAELDRWQ